MSTLEIHFLGECRFVYENGVVTGLQTRRMHSLLGFLLLHAGQQLSTTQLAFLFWPDSSEKQAKTNLRRLFFYLRNVFPAIEQFLNRNDHTVQWRTDAPYTCDVAQLETHLSAAQQALQAEDSSAARLHLEEAIRLQRGELLPDCYEDWLFPIRERLRQRYLETLDRLLLLLEEEGEYASAIRYGELLLRQDPLLEKTYRQLMQLHMLTGDHASALRLYHVCTSTLERELGVEPHPETTTLHQRLLKFGEHTAERPTAIPDHLPESIPLVGRQHERRQLLTLWRKAARGHATFVLIGGEAGIGKSRLAQELYLWVSQLGIDAVRTRSYPASAGLAYAPVIDWLRSDRLALRLQRLESVWLSELARLLPDLLVMHPELPPPQPLTEEWQRQRLFATLAHTLHGDRQPLLLWLDDLQWCDRETLAWLQYLVQVDPAAPLLILGTLRREEVTLDHPLLPLVYHLRQIDRLVEIDLERLDALETSELASRVANIELSVPELRRLYEDTDGNPLFVVEMVRAAREQTRTPSVSAPSVTMGATREPIKAGAQVLLPPKVYGVIQSRLAQLSPLAHELVGLAATVGRSFTVAILAQASELAEGQLVRAIDELWQRRIVREQGIAGAEDAYDFSHDRIRDVAYDELSPIRRRRYHRAIALGLERLYAAQLAEWSAELAHHHEQAGNYAQARSYYRCAGQRATDQFAHSEALAYFTRALHLLGDPVTQDAAERFDLHALRERVHHLQASRAAQEEELAIMLALADALKDEQRRCIVWLRRSALAEGHGAYGEAVVAVQQAIQAAQSAASQRQQAEGYIQFGSVLWNRGIYPQAEEQYRQALHIAQTSGERDLEATTLLHLGALNVYCGDYHEALRISEQALLSTRVVGNREGEIWAHNQLGFCIVEQGDDDYAQAVSHLTTGLALARKIGSRAYVAKLASNLAMLYDRQGAYEAALACLDESLAIAQETDSARHRAFSLNHRANTLEHQGMLAAAQERYGEALAIFQRIGYRQGEGKTLSELGMLHVWLGDHQTALDLTDQALAIAHQVGIQRDQAYALTRKGYALEGLSQWQAATNHYEQALAVYRLTGQRNRALEPTVGLARIALAQGDSQRALDRVESIFLRLQTHRLDATNEAWWVHFTCWQVLHAAHDPRTAAILHQTRNLLAQRLADHCDFAQHRRDQTLLGHFATLLQRSPGYPLDQPR
jgi:predicted ATPase/DNA-binding SARP family transcriptional activator